MEAWEIALATLAIIMTGGSMVAAGVWAVAKISGSVDRLSGKVDVLGTQVNMLSAAVTTLDDKLDAHGERITRLEAKNTES